MTLPAKKTTEKDMLTPLTKTRLHQEIVEQLKDHIVRGDFAPGARLPPERDLADQLHVNRTTVREALHKLESMGLVEIKHGSGIFVKDFLESGSLELARHLLFLDGRVNHEVLGNLLHLRRLLVPEICGQAARNRNDHDLAELERVVGRDDLPIDEKDWRVHNIIARASGNTLFVIFLNSFTSLAEDSSRLYFSVEKNQRRSKKFHLDILQAIRARDVEAAKRIMTEVLEYAEDQTLKALGATIKGRKK